MKHKKYFIFVIVCSFLLSACSNNSKPQATPVPSPTPSKEAEAEIKNTSKDLELTSIEVSQTKTYESEVTEYNLGKREYQTASGKIMPYELRGVLGVPKEEGTFPLVIITHGSHSNEDASLRFDTGFTYLVEYLSQHGIIAVSMDMSSAYIWAYGDSDDKEKSIVIANDQMESLKSANDGLDSKFPIDIKNKIDFSKVALIGHSRGGDTIFDIALSQEEKELPIKGLLSIAPTLSADMEEKELPNCPASILVPEYDGDVIALDGISIFTILEEKSAFDNSVTVLKRANHNYFNTNLTNNDALLARTEDELKDQLEAEKQHDFLSEFALDFCESIFTGKTGHALYDPSLPSPNQMYGLDVLTILSPIEKEEILDADDTEDILTQDLTAKEVTDSWFFENDQTPIDTVTFGQDDYKTKELLHVQWEKSNSFLRIPIEENNFRSASSISIQTAADSASELNTEDKMAGFTLSFRDTQGNTCQIHLPDNSNVLEKTKGFMDNTPLENTTTYFWSHPTPIGSIRIPISMIEGINLESVSELTITFDKAEKGSLYIESISLLY